MIAAGGRHRSHDEGVASAAPLRRCRRRNNRWWMSSLLLMMTMMLLALSSMSMPHVTVMAADEKPASVAEDKAVTPDAQRIEMLLKKLNAGKRLTREEVKELNVANQKRYEEVRSELDEVSNNRESAMLRSYRLRHLKREGLFRKRERSLTELLFPGVKPQHYRPSETMDVYADWVESKQSFVPVPWVKSKQTFVPFEYHDLPTCFAPSKKEEVAPAQQQQQQIYNLVSRLQEHKSTLSPYIIRAKEDVPCTPLCLVKLEGKKLRWLRKLIEQQYRVHLTLDQLPVLMRSKELNYAVLGYPVGFKALPGTDLPTNEVYLYNHLKFTISYNEVSEDAGSLRIIGFDVHPVSIKHDIPLGLSSGEGSVKKKKKLTTCNDNVVNDPSTYLALRRDLATMSIVYSYEVIWQQTEIQWADRWDVYLIGSPNYDIYYFSIVKSLMIAVILTGAVVTISIRAIRKDIAGRNEMQTSEEAQEKARWKLLNGDVFRPPLFSPVLLSVLVGTGAQIGVTFLCAILCAILELFNPMYKGQTLAVVFLLYVLSGTIAGYTSARLCKFYQTTAWKHTTIITATLLPGPLVVMFSFLNYFLGVVGAATAVSFFSIVAFVLLWICLSVPLVFLGSFLGLRANKIEVPTKTSQSARVVPDLPWYLHPFFTMIVGGLLPLASVSTGFVFVMNVLWLDQMYYDMRFLLAQLFSLVATCALSSVAICYVQLYAEDYCWWWKSFWNSASSGFYLFLYSLWFLSSRLDVVGVLPLLVYWTYMCMIALCFGVFCGAVGVLSNFWFTRTIYGAVKVSV